MLNILNKTHFFAKLNIRDIPSGAKVFHTILLFTMNTKFSFRFAVKFHNFQAFMPRIFQNTIQILSFSCFSTISLNILWYSESKSENQLSFLFPLMKFSPFSPVFFSQSKGREQIFRFFPPSAVYNMKNTQQLFLSRWNQFLNNWRHFFK